MLIKKMMFLMFFTALIFAESELKKPESFKDYKKYSLDKDSYVVVFIAPKLIKSLKIKKEKNDENNYIQVMFLTINGQELKLSLDDGESADPSFVFKYKGKKKQIDGEIIFISQSGTMYVSNRTNEIYEVKRKFKITKNGIKEVKQAFLSVNLECKTSALATLYSQQGDKGNVVATIPKGRMLKVLVNSFRTHEANVNSSPQDYLVQTSFGLIGWVRSSAGYMQQKGKPLGCLMYEGD